MTTCWFAPGHRGKKLYSKMTDPGMYSGQEMHVLGDGRRNRRVRESITTHLMLAQNLAMKEGLTVQ